MVLIATKKAVTRYERRVSSLTRPRPGARRACRAPAPTCRARRDSSCSSPRRERRLPRARPARDRLGDMMADPVGRVAHGLLQPRDRAGLAQPAERGGGERAGGPLGIVHRGEADRDRFGARERSSRARGAPRPGSPCRDGSARERTSAGSAAAPSWPVTWSRAFVIAGEREDASRAPIRGTLSGPMRTRVMTASRSPQPSVSSIAAAIAGSASTARRAASAPTASRRTTGSRSRRRSTSRDRVGLTQASEDPAGLPAPYGRPRAEPGDLGFEQRRAAEGLAGTVRGCLLQAGERSNKESEDHPAVPRARGG